MSSPAGRSSYRTDTHRPQHASRVGEQWDLGVLLPTTGHWCWLGTAQRELSPAPVPAAPLADGGEDSASVA